MSIYFAGHKVIDIWVGGSVGQSVVGVAGAIFIQVYKYTYYGGQFFELDIFTS